MSSNYLRGGAGGGLAERPRRGMIIGTHKNSRKFLTHVTIETDYLPCQLSTDV